MYVVTNHNRQIAEWSEAEKLRGVIDDLPQIIRQNEIYRQVMAEKDSGRPGHYYGRNAVLEGAIPAAVFFGPALVEHGGDTKWWRDDAKFQAYLRRNPMYSWLNG